jgi:putative transposase
MPPLYLNNKIYFITFRLDDSLPQSEVRKMKVEYAQAISEIKEDDLNKKQLKINEIAFNVFGKYEHQLDENPYGECILAKEEVAEILYNKILSGHKVQYDLKCFSIMPNHVHILLSSLGNTPDDKADPVNSLLKNIKGSTARSINKLLNKLGTLWNNDNWDRYIRNERHYSNVFYYVANNPINARLNEKFTKPPFMWRKDFA